MICGVHFWDYRLDSGVSEYNNDQVLAKFASGVDWIILDGSGGGTGVAPILFRDNISVPTIPALARACGHDHLNQFEADDLITWKQDIGRLAGMRYGGVG